ncbi:MAG TPA: hypothetical protein DCY20_10860 [Firmicutes bacterium]|nr:hypothetical protein [Bacillota bacterium]
MSSNQEVKEKQIKKQRSLDEMRELLYYEHYNDVEFGVEQAYTYPISSGWIAPDFEEASTLAVDKAGDPLHKYTK